MPLLKAKSSALVSDSFFIFIIRFFPSLANLLILIIYSRCLPQDVYGQYQHFWIHLYIFYPLICIGLHVLIVTYSRGFVLQLASRIKPLHFVLYGAWSLAVAVLFAWLQLSAGVSLLVSLLFILTYGLSFILESFLIVSRKFLFLTITNFLYALAFCLVHWYYLGAWFSPQSLFTALLGITALRFILYILFSLKGATPPSANSDEQFSVASVRRLWLHLGIYDVVQVLSNYADKFVISLLLTAELSAIYYNGSQNIPFLPLLLSAAGSAALIQLAGGRKDDEQASSIRLMNQSGRVLSSIVFPLFFFLLFYRSDLLITLLTDKYAAAVPVFLACVLVIPVRAYSFTTILQRQHRGDIINIGAISELLLACALMYPLYSWLGLPGVALSFVASTYFQAIYYLYWSGKLLGVSPLKLLPVKNWLIKLIVFCTLFIAIHYATDQIFSRKIALTVGALAMVLSVIISLGLELKKTETYGNRT